MLNSTALGWTTMFSLALMPMTLVLPALEPRMLGAEFLWLKPLKFQISMAVMCGTLVLAGLAAGPTLACSPWVRVPSVLVAMTATHDLTFLGIQAARGVRSHFNSDTALDQIGGMVMVAGAGVLVLGAAAIGVAILEMQAAKGWAALEVPLLLAIGLGLVLGGILSGQTGAIGANQGPIASACDGAGPTVP